LAHHVDVAISEDTVASGPP